MNSGGTCHVGLYRPREPLETLTPPPYNSHHFMLSADNKCTYVIGFDGFVRGPVGTFVDFTPTPTRLVQFLFTLRRVCVCVRVFSGQCISDFNPPLELEM